MIHKAALVSKTIPKRLHEHMSVIIKVVNYVKSSALNTRLFSKLCKDMDADHTALLYHTQVRWLSKENMLSRIFELSEEVKLFLVAKQKHDLLLAFGGDGFSTYLAYLADIFEVLNQLNKKLQGPGTNIIVLDIQALNILVPFSSTYLCECGFSALLTIKPKARNRLHVQSDICCALSTTLPDIEKLVAKKARSSVAFIVTDVNCFFSFFNK